MDSSADPVTVALYRWPDVLDGRTTMVRLGDDDHGIWLCDMSPDPAAVAVRLLPPSAWWTACWVSTDDGTTLTVQTSRPAVWSEESVDVMLLDLEVERGDGDVALRHEERFARNRQELGYPEPVVDMARTTTAAVYLAVTGGEEPFGDVGDGWLGIARMRASM